MTTHLLERDGELERLRRAFKAAADGQGAGIAVSGESGAGKSTLIAAALDGLHGFRVLRGQCEPLQTPRPLGPFRELGLPGVDAVVGADDARPAEVGERLYLELGSEPTALVVEDLHWADEASIELLRFLARRVEAARLVLVLSYRDTEIGARHPARALLGDFAVQDGLSRIPLAPLSVDGVAAAVEGTGLDPRRVHAVTGGNPFFVAQVVREPERPLPTSVRDAVLARVADVDLPDLEVLQLIACAPDRLDARLLRLVNVDLDTLRRLDETALLAQDEHGLAYRHELARLAVESTIPPGGAVTLHQRLLEALEELDLRDPAVLTHHALAARDSARAARYARAAAAEATATASNTQAASFLEIALSHLPGTTEPAERAGLLLQLSLQHYLTGRIADAIASARASIPLSEAAGQLTMVAEAYSVMAVLEYHSARRRNIDLYMARAVTMAEEAGVPETLVRAVFNETFLVMLTSDRTRALDGARRTSALAADAGIAEYATAGQMINELVACMSGDRAARARVLELADVARERGWDELASRAYDTVAFVDVEQGNLRGLQEVVDTALAHADKRDLPVARLWIVAARATLHMLAGRWDAAIEDAESVLAGARLPGCIHPDLVVATVRMRRGAADFEHHAENTVAAARGLDEPMRLIEAYVVLAESMWLTGRRDQRVIDAAARIEQLGGLPDTRWPAGNLAVWLRRLGVSFTEPADVPEPFRSSLDGRHCDAATWWQAAGSPFNQAMALADSPEPDDRVRAVTILDRLSANGTADRLRRQLRLDGVVSIPQRPTETTRANPGGLTNRQLDVARLLARGLTNSEIATEVFISQKTAEHHVSAVLSKLGLPNRRAVVQAASELGLA
ncbi:ATP-binding protein [Nakamurella sp. GG22]